MMDTILKELHAIEYTHPNINSIRNLFQYYIVGV